MRTQYARAATSHVVALALLAIVAGGTKLFAQASPSRISVDSLAKVLAGLRESSDSAWIPAASKFTIGDSTVAANRTITGPVAVAGTLNVRGTIAGDAVSYGGDIIVHQGGAVRGNAYAINGKVTLDGGTVDGDTRALGGDLRQVSAAGGTVARSKTSAMAHALALAGGWLAVLVIVGIGVLIFASTNLDAVADALDRGFGKALLAGVATQIALAPALALLCIGLVLTILGALLVPFAIVAYVIAAAGLVTLGYLAIARNTGRTLLDADAPADGAHRAAALRTMVYGLIVLMLPWFIAGALSWSPRLELIARIFAVSLTWVAATAGLGAAVVSRGGVRRAAAPATERALNTSSWATPTPVSGVTAARRPTPYTASVPK